MGKSTTEAKKHLWEVHENSGMDNDQVVFESASFKEADDYITQNYTKEEIDDLPVLLTRDGSYEW